MAVVEHTQCRFKVGADAFQAGGCDLEPLVDRGQSSGDAVLFGFEQVERYRAGVMGLQQFAAFVDQSLAPNVDSCVDHDEIAQYCGTDVGYLDINTGGCAPIDPICYGKEIVHGFTKDVKGVAEGLASGQASTPPAVSNALSDQAITDMGNGGATLGDGLNGEINLLLLASGPEADDADLLKMLLGRLSKKAAEDSILPKLTGTIAESFEGGAYTTRTYKAGTIFYRAEGADQGIGSFFGLANPTSAADAEKMYNIAKWGNKAEVVTTYKLTKDTTMYVGDVAGGSGQQALLARGTNASSVFQQVGQESLP